MIRLVSVTEDNWLDIAALAVQEHQRNFVAPAVGILARGYVYRDCNARVYAFENDGVIVGAALVREFTDEPLGYDLQQFMIGRQYQHRGYGSEALRLILEELRNDYETMISRCRAEGIEVLMISCFGNETLPDGRIPDFSQPGLSLDEYAAGIAVFERELAAKYHCGYVPDMQCGILPKGRPDLWGDSNHPNAAGNRIVADTILPELRKLPGF